MSESKSRVIRKRKRTPAINYSDLASIRMMERFLHNPEHSLLDGNRKKELEKILIFSGEKQFNKGPESFPYKVFRRETVLYRCLSYSEYDAIDLMTGKTIATALIENDWLSHIEVKENYRRRGIGTHLMRAIVKVIGKKFHIPAEGLPGNTSYYLTTEGAALINSCIRKGIIDEEQCMLEPPSTPPRFT